MKRSLTFCNSLTDLDNDHPCSGNYYIFFITLIKSLGLGLDGGGKNPTRKSIKLKESSFVTEAELRTCSRGPFRTYGRSYSFEIAHYCTAIYKRSSHENYFQLGRDCDNRQSLDYDECNCSNSFTCTNDRGDYVNMKMIDNRSAGFQPSDALMVIHEPKLNFVDNVKIFVSLS